jgi:hypothetical protein
VAVQKSIELHPYPVTQCAGAYMLIV